MKSNSKQNIYKLCISAIFVALATALSFIKIINMPLGGSVTLLSMLPIVMISCMLGLKWGMASSFVYSLIQLFLGIALDGIFAWGLTPTMLIGTIVLDYIAAFSVLGLAGIFSKKGYIGNCLGTAMVLVLRFICHFISGYVIFTQLEQFELFGQVFSNRPFLYSLCYNGLYMVPELIFTVVAALILFKIPPVKKIFVK